MSKQNNIIAFLGFCESAGIAEVHTDSLHRFAYATDASIYEVQPEAVIFPRNKYGLKLLVKKAAELKIPLIPRAAGTSLAGQCVGNGVILDLGRHLNRIIEINPSEMWAIVEPGVIRDELNLALKPYKLHFGPNTSTANRCMLGGMLGNNSCGSSSIKYGSTRDHVLEVETILTDGSEALWKEYSADETQAISNSQTRQGQILRQLISCLSIPEVQEEIRRGFPLPEIHRRNTGYAVDLLIEQHPFNPNGRPLNIAHLLAGSEGTLAITTAIKLSLSPLPPTNAAIICLHYNELKVCMEDTPLAMSCAPYQCELIDRIILTATKTNLGQVANRFFVEGDPAAILCVELREDSEEKLSRAVNSFRELMARDGHAYAAPVVVPPDDNKVWSLRQAGLGLLSNVPGEAKAVAFVEDGAVPLAALPAYTSEFAKLMKDYNQTAVYYGHAGAGELHLRPVLNLKTNEGRKQLKEIGRKTAELIKMFGGSLSGEHGDGRVRAGYIPLVLGEKNYQLLREIKTIFDPDNIFNPGKIVDPLPIDTDLRFYSDSQATPKTFLNFGENGLLAAVEKCNGSGDCRKMSWSGGTMCPSYQATRNELDSTRARANTLRIVLTEGQAFSSQELIDILDLCLSCKGCKRECPSNIDMAAFKAESLYQQQLRQGVKFRSRIFGNFHTLASIFQTFAPPYSEKLGSILLESKLAKQALGISTKRQLPAISHKSGTSMIRASERRERPTTNNKKTVCLYIDEFTQFSDSILALDSYQLLTRLNYSVKTVYSPSGRALISKGMLKHAHNTAVKTVTALADFIRTNTPIVGIEPSAVLSFRDEYLMFPWNGSPMNETASLANQLAKTSYTIEEFLSREITEGIITANQFTEEKRKIHLHLHCHQKALCDPQHSLTLLNLPRNYSVNLIPSGCCGMAGSFGYEREHYDLSMKIGEMVLLPAVRKADPDDLIVASGTSCRQQIIHGSNKAALHPVQVMLRALRELPSIVEAPAAKC
ncbi:MAG: FAD-linked oxidase C-terminal domain-containing protein [bacterium]|nr:FAD-linked oxidase C-terminal domain-containing protein [bacterium]